MDIEIHINFLYVYITVFPMSTERPEVALVQ